MPIDPKSVSSILDQSTLDALTAMGDLRTPNLPASDEGLEAEFFLKVYEFSRSWLVDAGSRAEKAAPCAFLLSRAIRQDMERLGAEVVHYFAATPDADIEGKIFIANDDLSIVAMVPTGQKADVAQIGKCIVDLDLTAMPHAVVRLSRSEMIICKNGLPGGSEPMAIKQYSEVRLSELQLEKLMWEFHRAFTQTPSGYLHCWRGSPATRVTSEELERQISGIMSFYLGKEVGPDHVTAEHHTPHGRIDIKLSAPVLEEGKGPCALELKILRSRQFSKNAKDGYTPVSAPSMVKYAKEGVDQACEYREDIDAKTAYAIFFDARFDDEDQVEVVDYAALRGISMKRYFMYDSPRAHRSAKSAAVVAGKTLSGEVTA